MSKTSGHHVVKFHQSPVKMRIEIEDLVTRRTDSEATTEELNAEGSSAPSSDPAIDQEAIEELFRSFVHCLNDHEQRRQESYREMRLLSVELGVAIATKLVFRELQSEAGIIEPLVESLIGDLDRSQHCMIWLNPGDHQIILNSCTESIVAAKEQIEFLADPSIAPGDCRVESGKDVLVSNIHSKLTEVRQQLLESLNDADIERRQPKTKNRGLGRFPERRAIG